MTRALLIATLAACAGSSHPATTPPPATAQPPAPAPTPPPAAEPPPAAPTPAPPAAPTTTAAKPTAADYEDEDYGGPGTSGGSVGGHALHLNLSKFRFAGGPGFAGDILWEHSPAIANCLGSTPAAGTIEVAVTDQGKVTAAKLGSSGASSGCLESHLRDFKFPRSPNAYRITVNFTYD